MKLLVAVVLLACASTALAGYPFKPVYKAPECKKACKADYEECKDVVEEVCAPMKPVYTAPVYSSKGYHGRRLSDAKPAYVCPKIKVTKKVCEKKPCTVTVYVDKTSCKMVCPDPKAYHPTPYGRKLQAAYKPVYTPAPVYVAPTPKCEQKCETIKVPETKCLDQCVYDDCPKPAPVKKPVYNPKPKPAPKPTPVEKPDIKDLISSVIGKIKDHDK